MPASEPTFSPYPFDRLRRVTPREAAIESLIARWIDARPLGARVAELVGGPVRVRIVGSTSGPHADPHAALAEVRIAGVSIVLAGSSRPVRALTQRVLGGPAELDAPRPLTITEHAIWALAIAAAIEDLGIAAEVWPLADAPVIDAADGGTSIELAVSVAGDATRGPITVIARCPGGLAVQAPPVRTIPSWPIEVPVVLARAAIPRSAIARLAVRDVITVESAVELVIGDGAIGLHLRGGSGPGFGTRTGATGGATRPEAAAEPGTPAAVVASVATEYVRRDMALPDEAHLELTVQLGTTRLTLRQIGELSVGQIVSLGRPLAGPYEVRAAGRLVGQGELIDIDGELGVRIVSLIPEE